jgi:hypothetical protein
MLKVIKQSMFQHMIILTLTKMNIQNRVIKVNDFKPFGPHHFRFESHQNQLDYRSSVEPLSQVPFCALNNVCKSTQVVPAPVKLEIYHINFTMLV